MKLRWAEINSVQAAAGMDAKPVDCMITRHMLNRFEIAAVCADLRHRQASDALFWLE
jgi:hypothetical protein